MGSTRCTARTTNFGQLSSQSRATDRSGTNRNQTQPRGRHLMLHRIPTTNVLQCPDARLDGPSTIWTDGSEKYWICPVLGLHVWIRADGEIRLDDDQRPEVLPQGNPPLRRAIWDGPLEQPWRSMLQAAIDMEAIDREVYQLK